MHEILSPLIYLIESKHFLSVIVNQRPVPSSGPTPNDTGTLGRVSSLRQPGKPTLEVLGDVVVTHGIGRPYYGETTVPTYVPVAVHRPSLRSD